MVIDSFECDLAGTERVVADAPGMNSKRLSSAGINTGASAIVLSERDVVPTVTNCIGLLSVWTSLRKLKTGSPGEKWGGSDLETKERW
jgi:hypothetical protein